MCGRYTLTRLSDLTLKFPWILPVAELTPRFNIAPSQAIMGLVNDGSKRLAPLRWGLIPSWAGDERIGNRLINARAETLAQKPAFRTALRRRRCIIPADGFYEWRKEAGGGKTPMYIHMKDKQPFAFAGLWDDWHSPDGGVIRSCTIITTDANALIEPIHNRMPVILSSEACRRWIEPAAVAEDELPAVTALLKPYPAAEMEAFAVSRLVNSPAHDSPHCVEAAVDAPAVHESRELDERTDGSPPATSRGATAERSRPESRSSRRKESPRQGRLFE